MTYNGKPATRNIYHVPLEPRLLDVLRRHHSWTLVIFWHPVLVAVSLATNLAIEGKSCRFPAGRTGG